MEGIMKRLKNLLIGLLMGTVLISPALALKWELQCDGNVCCTVNQETGEIGDCEPV
jgi:hypothetical protein